MNEMTDGTSREGVIVESGKKARPKYEKKKNMMYVLKEGFMDNPLLKHGRNNLCLCGSGLKFKKCCLNKLPTAIPKDLYEYMKGKDIYAQAEVLFNAMSDKG